MCVPQSVDADHSGKISAAELRQALVNGNWTHFNPETCRLLIGMFDHNRSVSDVTLHYLMPRLHVPGMAPLMCMASLLCGSIFRTGGSVLTGRVCPMVTRAPDPSVLVCRFDKDKSGNIDASELQQALSSFGFRL